MRFKSQMSRKFTEISVRTSSSAHALVSNKIERNKVRHYQRPTQNVSYESL